VSLRRLSASFGFACLAVVVGLSIACGGGSPAEPKATDPATGLPVDAQGNFSPDYRQKAEFWTLARNMVKEQLNFPDEASFGSPESEKGVGPRSYQVNGSVTAKNALGVRSTMPFSITWHREKASGKFKVGYFSLDGKTLSDVDIDTGEWSEAEPTAAE
jgi:hypothetical protein